MKFVALVVVLSAASAAAASARQQLTAQEAFGIAVSRLDPCERAIWSCCQSDRATFRVPSECFAANGCYGLHWIGARACSPGMLNAVGLQIQRGMAAAFRESQRQAGGGGGGGGGEVDGLRFGFGP